jgi:hypothetical protein
MKKKKYIGYRIRFRGLFDQYDLSLYGTGTRSRTKITRPCWTTDERKWNKGDVYSKSVAIKEVRRLRGFGNKNVKLIRVFRYV